MYHTSWDPKLMGRSLTAPQPPLEGWFWGAHPPPASKQSGSKQHIVGTFHNSWNTNTQQPKRIKDKSTCLVTHSATHNVYWLIALLQSSHAFTLSFRLVLTVLEHLSQLLPLASRALHSLPSLCDATTYSTQAP